MPQEDTDAAEEIAKILQEDGIEILLETNTLRVAQDDEGRIHLIVRVMDMDRTLVGSHLLIAAGRAPNTDRLMTEREDVMLAQASYSATMMPDGTGAP